MADLVETPTIAAKDYKVIVSNTEFKDLEVKDDALIMAIQDLTKEIRALRFAK